MTIPKMSDGIHLSGCKCKRCRAKKAAREIWDGLVIDCDGEVSFYLNNENEVYKPAEIKKCISRIILNAVDFIIREFLKKLLQERAEKLTSYVIASLIPIIKDGNAVIVVHEPGILNKPLNDLPDIHTYPGTDKLKSIILNAMEVKDV